MLKLSAGVIRMSWETLMTRSRYQRLYSVYIYVMHHNLMLPLSVTYYMHFYFSGRSNSSSSEASTPEAGTPDCRQPPPLLRTISEGTYTTIDSLSSTSSFSKSDMPVFDPQDAIIDDTCWDLKQKLSLEALKSNWKDESLDRVDSATPRLRSEDIKTCASIPKPVPYPNPQPSSVPGDVECTQLWFV